MSQDSKQRPVLEVWEPTYRMKPIPSEQFMPAPVEDIIKNTLDSRLKDMKYDASTVRQLSADLCAEIKEQVKQLKIPRYKLVVQCVLGQVGGQGAFVASRCLWDTDTDNYASYAFKNNSLFCVAMVFGIYAE